MPEILYIVHHWWDGDKWSDPQWVHSGTFGSLDAAHKCIAKSRQNNFKKHRLQKITKEFLDVPINTLPLPQGPRSSTYEAEQERSHETKATRER